MQDLPAAAIAGELNFALASEGCAVVTAPPGAGKSTILPLAILRGLEPRGKIIVLEPRRIAARQIAERMAQLLGEPVGRTVGYRVRFETKAGPQTRIEVVSEGILTRMMIQDPTLDGVAVVVFDEFHERSIVCDEAFAFVRELRSVLRPELRVAVMSATIDAGLVCAALGAPLISCEGRMFPVEISHSLHDTAAAEVASEVAAAVRSAHSEHEGDILAFLPGEAEIRRCAEILGSSLGSTHICPLYGMLPFERQHDAIAPSRPGERKVVLATPIAETSLTIEGVRIVVDSGWCRKQVVDPSTGLGRLETVRISADMAAQRAGRAGRVAPGVCVRLWCRATDGRLAETRVPEILEADLAPVVLDAAAWGANRPQDLPWLTPPPAAGLRQASDLLRLLGAVSDSGAITPHGKALCKMPCHPRVAQMLVQAQTPELKALAADIAALLEDRDPGGDGADFTSRLAALRAARSSRGGWQWGRALHAADQYCRLAGVAAEDSAPDPYAVGALVAAAFPERVAKARPGGFGRYLLSGGEAASLAEGDPLSGIEWLAVASANIRKGGEGRIFLAAPVAPEDLLPLARTRDKVAWDSRGGSVIARRETNVGCLPLSSVPLGSVPRAEVCRVICEAVAKEGESMLDFNEAVGNLQRRVAAVSLWHPELGLPDLSTAALLPCAGEWLEPFLGRATTVQELRKIDLCAVLWAFLGYERQQAVERLAPSHVTVPTGSSIRLEYRAGADAPVLRVRLQECFGLAHTPRVDGGRIPVLMELLSPGYKPVQLTTDLQSFWQSTYFEVRKELRRRYPKHSWPDDPLAAPAVRGVRKK